jgi:hypothetical protein
MSDFKKVRLYQVIPGYVPTFKDVCHVAKSWLYNRPTNNKPVLLSFKTNSNNIFGVQLELGECPAPINLTKD